MIFYLLFWGTLPISLSAAAILSHALSIKSSQQHDSGIIVVISISLVALLYSLVYALFLLP